MRSMSDDVLAQIQSPTVRPIFLVSIGFLSGAVYVWSGYGSLTWNSHTWIGTGELGGISAVTQGTNVAAESITLSLTGIPNDLVVDAMNETNQNCPVQIYFGFLDMNAGTVVADPILIFSGSTDIPTITCGAETSGISITCENPLIRLNLASNRTYTQDDQFIDYPTDTGFQFVPSIQLWDGNWGVSGGSNPAIPGSTASGGGTGTSGGVGTGSQGGNPKLKTVD